MAQFGVAVTCDVRPRAVGGRCSHHAVGASRGAAAANRPVPTTHPVPRTRRGQQLEVKANGQRNLLPRHALEVRLDGPPAHMDSEAPLGVLVPRARRHIGAQFTGQPFDGTLLGFFLMAPQPGAAADDVRLGRLRPPLPVHRVCGIPPLGSDTSDMVGRRIFLKSARTGGICATRQTGPVSGQSRDLAMAPHHRELEHFRAEPNLSHAGDSTCVGFALT
jgi:hypothetical protein